MEGISDGLASEQAMGSKAGSLGFPNDFDVKSLGEKRNGYGSGEGDEFGSKRVKVRDLGSDLAVSDEATNLKSVVNIEEIVGQSNLSGKEKYGVTEVSVVPGAECSDRVGIEKDTIPMDLRPSTARVVIEMNTCVANPSSISTEDNGKQPVVVKPIGEENIDLASEREFSLDAKVDDIISIDKHDLSRFQKNGSLLKSREVSESGSLGRAVDESDPLLGCKEIRQDGLLQCPLGEKVGPLQLGGLGSPSGESDSMRRWKEMKRNGFLSGPLGGAAVASSVVLSSSSVVLSPPVDTPVQKQQKGKRRGDCLKKKKEPPKREQADRFSSVAAPSGLLKELNPGIINHVRNKKQVCSIIKALVRIGSEDVVGEESHVDSNLRGTDYSHFSRDDVSLADLEQKRETFRSAYDSSPTIFEGMVDPRTTESVREDWKVPIKLPSNEASENASSITNVESANCPSPNALIIEAATVASQWLDLLHRDISGRLSVLEHSKSRVQSILTTELPLLASREFLSNQENSPQMMNTSSHNGFSDKTMMEHQTRWIALFDQMNKSLSDEKTELECWLNQVKEMQSHCNEGLRFMDIASAAMSSQSSGVSEVDSRSEKESSVETSMAVQAAAASIYSTCSFLMSTRNSTCL